jgi:CrcB protein
MMGRGFPFGTLAVNVIGSFAISVLFVLFVERGAESVGLRAFFMIGLLGAFTTFSTFSIETLQLVENTELTKAMFNVLGNVALCIIACWCGFLLGRQI